MNILLDFGKSEVLQKVPAIFGNGAHILFSRDYVEKRIKIISGKVKIIGKKLEIDFSSSEILDRKIKSFGTGAHVVVPKNYSGKKLNVVVGGKNE